MITLKIIFVALNLLFALNYPVNSFYFAQKPFYAEASNGKPKVEEKVAISAPKPKPVAKVLSLNPYIETGDATWYDYIKLLQKGGKDTSKLDPERLTAAHKTLPFGSVVLVEPLNQKDYKPVEVVINDRLPKASARTIDLHKASAVAMNPKFISRGVVKVKITKIR